RGMRGSENSPSGWPAARSKIAQCHRCLSKSDRKPSPGKGAAVRVRGARNPALVADQFGGEMWGRHVKNARSDPSDDRRRKFYAALENRRPAATRASLAPPGLESRRSDRAAEGPPGRPTSPTALGRLAFRASLHRK